MQLETLNAPYLENPCQWLEIFEALPRLALLDSCNFSGDSGRYHIITGAPQQWLTLQDGVLCYQNGSQQSKTKACSAKDCWAAIEKLQTQSEIASNLPFCGGLLGFVGYEFGLWSELGVEPSGEIDFPDFAVGNYRWALIQDNHRFTSQLVFLSDCDRELRQKIIHLTDKPIKKNPFKTIKINHLKKQVNVNCYKLAVKKIQDYIRAGDCYQVNYTQRFGCNQVQQTPLASYQALRAQQPGPMSAFLSIATNKALISLSPERLVKNDQGRVLAQPIKGTIARSREKQEDAALALQLVNSEKDRAENLMIVDLLRNDLGRVCLPGSIHVPKLFELESFENVHHLVSSITGHLAPQVTNIHLLQACFPGGSITGAPKRRAMEIIRETEVFGRSAYCGSVFYSSANGRFDANITIRTLVASDGELYCWGGGGITSDSNPDEEYQESMTKVAKLIGL
ncbi:aminodeoxychorismate synthase component I [Simiduia curdlanivorans]|uniref:aminodeoxychorismate synthase n=1 Tax=Simiduia curdlanivorans TaxID=1492769 RepID=A0ABV8V9G2_9GAMM|nr:aminodeoxychorismate synthase component I [Simiduia curdlanivorans]MDN3639822.1 aminodeoxychorismate synthase component I [Simiduia curdlanivorans]